MVWWEGWVGWSEVSRSTGDIGTRLQAWWDGWVNRTAMACTLVTLFAIMQQA
jgi:hypothetical protein